MRSEMSQNASERKIRASLPFLRFLQAYLPFQPPDGLMKTANQRARLPEGVTRQSVCADGVDGEWLIPRDSPSDRALLYLHGGGFVYRLSPLHIKMVAHLAQLMGVRALAVDYRVAPAHPYPAALDDCLAAYCWLLKQGFSSKNLVLAGDSAGGNLTITMMMKLRDTGQALPAAAACLSPVGDLSGSGKPDKPVRDPLLHPRAMRRYNRSYVGQADARDPLISPVLGNWHGLPPLLVHAGEEEILREDAARMVELAQAAGVEAQLAVYPRMFHVWQLYLSLPEARRSLEEIAGFLASQKVDSRGLGREL